MGLELGSEDDERLATSVTVGLVAAIAGLLAGFLIGNVPENPTIGGQSVPNELHCEEDEAIFFNHDADEIPYPVACVHIDNITERYE